MKKRVSQIRVNAKKSRSVAMLRNFLQALLAHGKVETTSARAKIVKRYVDKELSYAVDLEDAIAKNRLQKRMGNAHGAKMLELFGEYARKNKVSRDGSFVTVVKTRFRKGDNSEMSEITLNGWEKFEKFVQDSAPKKKAKARKPAKKASKAKPKEKNEVAKKVEKKREEEKEKRQDLPKKDQKDAKKEGFLSNLGGRILGRQVQAPGKDTGRSTARSGL